LVALAARWVPEPVEVEGSAGAAQSAAREVPFGA